MKQHMKRLGLVFGLFLVAIPAFAQIPCAWNNVPLHDKIPFTTTNFANSGGTSKSFVVEGFQLLTACQMQGNFTVDVQTADTSTTNLYAFGLYYNSGGQGTAGALYTTTGQFTGDSHFSTVSSGVTIPAATTSECSSYPCTLPAGMYAIAMATNCASSCVALGGDDSLGGYSAFVATPGSYSSGLPSTITPVTVSPVLFSVKDTISVLIW